MKNKGNAMGVLFLELVITAFVVILFYVALDQPIKEDIIRQGQDMYEFSPGWNDTLNQLVVYWDAVPYVILFSAVGVLAIAALAGGG